jgi:hypothetical protein
VIADEQKPKPEYVKLYDVAWHCIRPIDSSYNWYNITGKVKNTSDISLSSVLLEFSIFDNKGIKISVIQKAGILNLKPGDVSEFSTTSPICASPTKGSIPYKFRLDRILYALE